MNEEILKRLDALAAKLGVASTALFGWAQKQVVVDAILGWIWTALISGIFYLSWRLFKHFSAEDEDPATVLCILGMVFAGLFGIIMLGCALYDTVGAIVNPEWAALKRIAALVKS